MRRIAAIIQLLLCATLFAGAQRVVERSYVATDRSVYVAGDRVWCSAFCLDAGGGHLSSVSSLLYLELHGDGGFVLGAKVALDGGRGAGSFILPATLPTGNYKLIAYTAQNRAEEGYRYDNGTARILSVFNPFTKERNGVARLSDEEYASLEASATAASADGIEIFLPEEGFAAQIARLALKASVNATVAVSVYRDGTFAPVGGAAISDFVKTASKVGEVRFSDDVLPEYEGEIIHGRIVGTDPARLAEWGGKTAFISSPGGYGDIYSARVGDDAQVRFFTGNIYGTRELVCDFMDADTTLAGHIELASPFVMPSVGAAAPLAINAAMASDVEDMAASVQIERHFHADTLFDYLPLRDNLLFGENYIDYRLDDYTRFPLMKEVFVEFLREIRPLRGGKEFQMLIYEDRGATTLSKGPVLVLIDGVPVFDHSKIYNYDPLLVEYIRIFNAPHRIGNVVFDGVADFVTYKRNLPAMKFGPNARVVQYQGVSLPAAFTGRQLPDKAAYPDFRRTAYWHPIVNLRAGESEGIEVRLPELPGRYRVVVEGLDENSRPVYATGAFYVR